MTFGSGGGLSSTTPCGLPEGDQPRLRSRSTRSSLEILWTKVRQVGIAQHFSEPAAEAAYRYYTSQRSPPRERPIFASPVETT